uniref:Uncharacterized protein n=1 Tax=Poecilia latipinna TaxID=48699 RepID=A0A3B3TQF6_9TELE
MIKRPAITPVVNRVVFLADQLLRGAVCQQVGTRCSTTRWCRTRWCRTGWCRTGCCRTGWCRTGWCRTRWCRTRWCRTRWCRTRWCRTGWCRTGWCRTRRCRTGWCRTGWCLYPPGSSQISSCSFWSQSDLFFPSGVSSSLPCPLSCHTEPERGSTSGAGSRKSSRRYLLQDNTPGKNRTGFTRVIQRSGGEKHIPALRCDPATRTC